MVRDTPTSLPVNRRFSTAATILKSDPVNLKMLTTKFAGAQQLATHKRDLAIETAKTLREKLFQILRVITWIPEMPYLMQNELPRILITLIKPSPLHIALSIIAFNLTKWLIHLGQGF